MRFPLLELSAPLFKAHQQLERAVDRCYQPEPFPSNRHRVEYLFPLYEQLTEAWEKRAATLEAFYDKSKPDSGR